MLTSFFSTLVASGLLAASVDSIAVQSQSFTHSHHSIGHPVHLTDAQYGQIDSGEGSYAERFAQLIAHAEFHPEEFGLESNLAQSHSENESSSGSDTDIKIIHLPDGALAQDGSDLEFMQTLAEEEDDVDGENLISETLA